jgi:glutathione S-transferase
MASRRAGSSVSDKTKLAPAELKQVQPLSKSPIISDGDKVIAESGAIIE